MMIHRNETIIKPNHVSTQFFFLSIRFVAHTQKYARTNCVLINEIERTCVNKKHKQFLYSHASDFSYSAETNNHVCGRMGAID